MLNDHCREKKRDHDFGSVSLSQHDKERILSERLKLPEYLERALQGECRRKRILRQRAALDSPTFPVNPENSDSQRND